MGEEIGVKGYLKEVRSLLSQLGGIRVIIDNDNFIQIILNVLPNNYDPFIYSLFVRGDSPTFEELVGWLVHDEHHWGLQFNNKHDKETLFVHTQHPFKSNNDERCKKTCNYYGQIDHWLWNCHERKANILKLETNKHTKLKASKLCQLANIMEKESYYGEHG